MLELEAEAADAVTAAYAELKAAGEVAATSHNKRKDMVKLSDLTTDLLDSKEDLPARFNKSTTEMQLMKRRRSNQRSGNDGDKWQSNTTSKTDPPEGNSPRPGLDSPMRIAAAQLDNMGGVKEKEERWEVVETLAFEAKNNKRRSATPYRVQNGKWSVPTLGRAIRGIKNKVKSLLMWTGDNSNEATDLLARDTTFAVITFTSRQVGS